MLERRRDRINVTKSYLFERITFYQPLEREEERKSKPERGRGKKRERERERECN